MFTEFSKKGVRYPAYATLLLNLLAGPGTLFAGPGAPIALVWTASKDKSVAGYNIYYGSSSGRYTNIVAAGNATSATISNLLAGTTYFFAATSYTAAGLESDYSAEAAYMIPTNAVLHAFTAASSGRSLTVLAPLGNTYQLQYTTNLGPTKIWYPMTTFTQTTPVQNIAITQSIGQVFYRVQQK